MSAEQTENLTDTTDESGEDIVNSLWIDAFEKDVEDSRPIVEVTKQTAETHPVTYNTTDEKVLPQEELEVAARMSEIYMSNGGSLDADEALELQENRVLEKALQPEINSLGSLKTSDDPDQDKQTPGTRPHSLTRSPTLAYAAASFLKTYGSKVALDNAQIKSALFQKLMELANHEEPKYALKAIELLGKTSDVNIFKETPSININMNDPTALEAEIRKRLFNIHKTTAHTTNNKNPLNPQTIIVEDHMDNILDNAQRPETIDFAKEFGLDE
jgi:hypothetical protein